MVEVSQYKWNRTEESIVILCVQWALHSPFALCAGEVLEEKQFTCPQAAPILQAISFLGCSQSVGGWNNACHRHLEKPSGKVASAEITLASVLPHNRSIHWQLLRECIHVSSSSSLELMRGERGKAWGSPSNDTVSFTSSIISSTRFLSFATVKASSGCCKALAVLKNSNWDIYVAKLILPALTWRGMLSTITCGRVMTVLTTGTLSTGELLQEKVKHRPCWKLYNKVSSEYTKRTSPICDWTEIIVVERKNPNP